MARGKNFRQGIFKPTNPQKYRGDVNNICYRSSWELRFCKYCDTQSNILEWSSEETVVPYYFPIDQKNHRYFVDFWITMVDVNKNVVKLLVEIKPSSEVAKPKQPKNNNRKAVARYNYEVETWIKNQCKWKAAASYADSQGMKFLVLTEHELFPRKLKS